MASDKRGLIACVSYCLCILLSVYLITCLCVANTVIFFAKNLTVLEC